MSVTYKDYVKSLNTDFIDLLKSNCLPFFKLKGYIPYMVNTLSENGAKPFIGSNQIAVQLNSFLTNNSNTNYVTLTKVFEKNWKIDSYFANYKTCCIAHKKNTVSEFDIVIPANWIQQNTIPFINAQQQPKLKNKIIHISEKPLVTDYTVYDITDTERFLTLTFALFINCSFTKLPYSPPYLSTDQMELMYNEIKRETTYLLRCSHNGFCLARGMEINYFSSFVYFDEEQNGQKESIIVVERIKP